VHRPGTVVTFYATPTEFIALAQEARLKLVRYWQHEDPNTRMNYLFRKAKASTSTQATRAAS
jgi:hypothetical protein